MPTLEAIQLAQANGALRNRFKSAVERACVDIFNESPRVAARVAWAKKVMFTIGPGQDRSANYAESILRMALHDSDLLRAAIDVNASSPLTDSELQALVSAYVQKLILADL